MKKVLIIEDIHQSGIKLLENNKNFSFEIVNNIEKNFLKNKIKDFDAITLKTFKFDNELIESAKNLKIISRHGVGYDNVDIESAKKKNITIEGVFENIDDKGNLILRVGSKKEIIDTGEIFS